MVNLNLVLRDVKGNITCMQKIICEVAFNDVPAVAAADHKVVYARCRVDFHNVPQDRLAPNFNHRFRPQVALLTDSCAFTTCKNYGLHLCSSPLLMFPFARCLVLVPATLSNV